MPYLQCKNEATQREDVEIDSCPQCRGVWLDRGELEKIIARMESQPCRGDDERDESDHHDERRRSGHRDRNNGEGDAVVKEIQVRRKKERRISEQCL